MVCAEDFVATDESWTDDLLEETYGF